jgi:hypothetical protein
LPARYTVERELGAGGMATVYLAHCHEAVRRHDPLFIAFAHGWTESQHLQELPAYLRLVASIGLPGFAVGADG